MLVDLRVRGKTAVVVGSGEAARSRALMLRREGFRVVMVRGRNPVALVRKLRPSVVFDTTTETDQNRALGRAAHTVGALVHVYDTPALSDFTMPSIGSAGAIRLAVSSSGQSPAMSVLLRRRLERAIRPIDVAQVRLQGRLRALIRRSIPTHEGRSRAIYRILQDKRINSLLRAGRFDEATARARTVVAAFARRSAPASRTG